MRFFRTLVGAVSGIGAGVALSPLLASFSESSGAIGLPIRILAGMLLGVFAPNMRRAFGRGFLLVDERLEELQRQLRLAYDCDDWRNF